MTDIQIKPLVLDSNTWNHLTGCKQMSFGLFKMLPTNDSFTNYKYVLIGLVDRVFTNGPGDLGSIQGLIIPKTLKMVLDTSLLSTQQYKVRIICKVEQSRERSKGLLYTSV